jgi:hypothetical protein
MGLVFHGAHEIAVDAENLDAVGALLFERSDPLASFVYGFYAAKHRVNEDARRGDLTFGGLLAKLQRSPGIAANIADRGDAAGQPDVELVLDGLGLPPRSS